MSRKVIIISALVILIPVAVFVFVKQKFEGDVSIGETLSQYGFVELKPPSTLVPPGTWVTVLNTNPLHLGIICTPESSLGLVGTDQLGVSSSADSEIISKLSGSFDLGAKALAKIKGESKFAEVRKISFQLKNIRVIELADEVVMRGLQQRTQPCREAILFRIEGKESVSMVKSVLIADVDYRVEFNRELESRTEADLKKQLALELDLRLGAGEDGSSSLVGRDLIWGIREDARLAKVGLGLPATGGVDDSTDSLSGKGAVTAISLLESQRMTFALDDAIVSYDVQPLLQTSAMSCWLTVYTMMKSWKDNSPLSVRAVVAGLGEPWDDYYLKDTGLPGGKEKEFVDEVGMESKPPANYTIKAYVDMLREHGPLWIITGDGISAHARLLVGIYGNPEAAGVRAYEETTFEFIDPLSGTHLYESGLDFARKFESEARWLVDGKLDDVELRDQILYWP